MTTLQGYATSIAPVNEIVCAYASGAYEPVLFATDAPWVVFGSFTVPAAVTARLAVSACKSGSAALTVLLCADGVRHFECGVLVVSGTELVSYSPKFNFVPNVLYQLVAQFAGADGSAAIRTVSLTS